MAIDGHRPRATRGPAAQAYEAYIGRWSRVVAREFVARLDRPAGTAWVDVGCGPGALTAAIVPRPIRQRRRRRSIRGLPGRSPRRACPIPGCGSSSGAAMPCRWTRVRRRGRLGTGAELPARPGGDARRDAPGDQARRRRRGLRVGLRREDGPDPSLLGRRRRRSIRQQRSSTRADGSRSAPPTLVDAAEAAGLRDPSVAALDIETPFRDEDDVWVPFLSTTGPAPGYAMGLDDDRREALRRRLPGQPAGREPTARSASSRGRGCCARQPDRHARPRAASVAEVADAGDEHRRRRRRRRRRPPPRRAASRRAGRTRSPRPPSRPRRRRGTGRTHRCRTTPRPSTLGPSIAGPWRRPGGGVDPRGLAAAQPDQPPSRTRTIAFDVTPRTSRQARSRSSCSASVGARRVSARPGRPGRRPGRPARSRGPRRRRCASTRAVDADRPPGGGGSSRRAGSSTDRRFGFVARIARAAVVEGGRDDDLEEDRGQRRRRRPRSTARVRATTPPKALTGSPARAAAQASRRVGRSAAPHGLVCLTMTHAGPRSARPRRRGGRRVEHVVVGQRLALERRPLDARTARRSGRRAGRR